MILPKERKREREREKMWTRARTKERKRIREKKKNFLIAISRDSIVTPLIVICAYKASEIKEI